MNAKREEIDSYDLWLPNGDLLTVSIDPSRKEWSAEAKHITGINNTIMHLARAAKAVVYSAENDDSAESSFLMQPIEALADAIILLSQLSNAIQCELNRTDSAPAEAWS